MRTVPGVHIENPEAMSEVERLRAAFMGITNTALSHIEKELEVARATADHEQKKVFQIQLGMFRHAQSIFDVAMNFATDEHWQNE